MANDYTNTLVLVFGAVVCGFLGASALSYAAHSLLVIITDTAAGLDEVRWPAESWIEWIGPLGQFAVFFLTLIFPVGVVLHAADDHLFPDQPALGIAVVVVTWLWLMFPVGLLSFMGAGSPFAIVYPPVIRSLFRLPSLIVFYIVTGIGAAGLANLWYLALFTKQPAWVVPAALATAWGLLIYGRLLGRIGWLAGQLEEPRRKRPAPKAKAKQQPQPRKALEVSDPWAAPVDKAEEPGSQPREAEKVPALPVGATGAASEASEKAGEFDMLKLAPLVDVRVMPAPQAKAGPAPAPYQVSGEQVDTSNIQLAPEDTVVQDEEVEDEPQPADGPPALARRRPRSDDTPAPDYPMFSGVYTFPWYATSVRAMVILTLAWAAFGFCLERIIAVFPS